MLAKYVLINGTSDIRISEEEYGEMIHVVRKHPYKKVLDYLIRREGKNKKLYKSIFECDFRVIDGKGVYVFKNCNLHSDLQTRETYLKVVPLMEEKVFGEFKVENFIL
jgi:hypothetical protein